MNDFQKVGGVAALIEAATYIVGFGLALTVFAPYIAGDVDPIAFLVDNQITMYAWNLIIYVVFGIFLVILALALHEKLKSTSSAMMQVATAFGLIWAGLVIASGMVANIGTAAVIDLYGKDPAQAATVWSAIDAVRNGLGGGNEIVGGLWVLLVSWAALQADSFPRILNYLGVVIGAAGIVTLVPALSEVGAIFGLGSIVWFIWLGIVMLRTTPNTAAQKSASIPAAV